MSVMRDRRDSSRWFPLLRRSRAALQGIRPGRLLWFLPWVVLLGYLANVAWFLTDDAFISFRYVRNLLEGHGLVFNRGEYVEGYSNFLWVLELAALWGAFGLRPESAAPWLSVACTAGTLAAMLWWVARLPGLSHRGLVGWMALGLVCSSATFAVWTSGGGLETRQFTFFIVLAVAGLTLYRENRLALLTVSLSLAAAALTRPEGPLFAGCCFAWYVMQHRADTGRWWPNWRDVAYLVGPCVGLVAAHYLFRYGYYGEWLPNTYYAKHVRPWYEAGWPYLAAAALETGLYLLLPLAGLALVKEWRARRSLTYALPLLCIVLHINYVARVGGDHFEYRPLDFYWPLLAVPAAEGIMHLGLGTAASVRRLRQFAAWPLATRPQTWALLLFLPVLFYSSAMQAALLFEGAKIDERTWGIHIELDEKNAGRLWSLPGMPMLAKISNDLRSRLTPQSIGMRFVEHREFAEARMRTWRPYENMERDLIPGDAVSAMISTGIQAYYVPDMTVIDIVGLTDATVARNPVVRPNHKRSIAHDRSPPPGYLEDRGVNFAIFSAASTWRTCCARYVVKVGPDLWAPFDATEHQWVMDRFVGRDLRVNFHFSPTDPSANLLHYNGRLYVGDQFLGRFDDGFDDWHLEGDAVTNHREYEYDQQPITGNVGPGFLTSYHPVRRDAAIGVARSPEFTATEDALLTFLIAGGANVDVGVRLLADGVEVGIWRGRQTWYFGFSEHLEMIVRPLADVAGKTLQLELFDHEPGGWGHIMLDHVLLVSPEERVLLHEERTSGRPSRPNERKPAPTIAVVGKTF